MEDMLDSDIVSNFISAIEELLYDVSCIVLSVWMDFEEKLSCILLRVALSFLSISNPSWALEDTDSKKKRANIKLIYAFMLCGSPECVKKIVNYYEL